MRTFAQPALAISVAAALLAGCGEAQPLISAPGVTPQASARSAVRRFSASYQQLYRFHDPFDGARPDAALLDVRGTLYGTTDGGGLSRKGTVYRISPNGAHKVLYRFRGGSDGRNPMSGLIDVNGTLYGTTYFGGSGTRCYSSLGCGTVYSISTSGTEKVLYSFKGGSDGFFPTAGLINEKGTLYGATTEGGGGCATDDECGTVFSVTTSGTEKVLHSFGGNGDGSSPMASLVAVNGTLYGTTYSSIGGEGTVFSITTSGKEEVLYRFDGGADGANPYASLIDVNGTLYGTTQAGGGKCNGYGCGTVFAITTSGQETVLHAFDRSDGAGPDGVLIDVNSTLYGTTWGGGAYGLGTLYSIGTSSSEEVLHSFGASGDGVRPVAGLIEVDATLYGTATGGGRRDRGTVFALTP